jgi:integrase
LDEAERLEETHGADAAGAFYRIATSVNPALKETLELWLPEASKTLTMQTSRQYRADAERFMEWAGKKKAVLVSDVTKRTAGAYVSECFDGLTAKTTNRHISTLSTWWRWMEKKGMVEDNPWRGQFQATKGKRGTTKGVRRHYHPEEITKLLQGLPERPLGALFRLGLFTGARLDELCSLRHGDVQRSEGALLLSITEGKTANAVRLVPVHSAIEPLVLKLKAEAEKDADGWLFPGLTPGGPDMKRSWNVSKRFTRERRKLGVDSPETVFHSTRKNIAEALEAAGVPLSTAKLIIGHERSDETFGNYSKGTYVNLKKSIEQVVYPDEVMVLV